MQIREGRSRIARRAAAIAVVAGLAGAARSAPAQEAPRETARETARGTPAVPQRWMVPHMLRVQGGAPQAVSLGVGAMRVVRRAGDGSMYAGPVVLVEPGLRAGKVQLGWGRTGAFATGWSVTAAYLRAWSGDDPEWTRPGRDHVGVEVAGSLMFLVGSVGIYRPLGGGGTRAAFGAGLTL